MCGRAAHMMRPFPCRGVGGDSGGRAPSRPPAPNLHVVGVERVPRARNGARGGGGYAALSLRRGPGGQ